VVYSHNSPPPPLKVCKHISSPLRLVLLDLMTLLVGEGMGPIVMQFASRAPDFGKCTRKVVSEMRDRRGSTFDAMMYIVTCKGVSLTK
jgi:hypothetical protein